MMIETTILLLLTGLGGKFYFMAQRKAAAATRAEQRANALDQEIARLNRELAAMHAAAARQRDEAECRRRYREENDIADIDNQIRFISQVNLYADRPVNKEAVRVLYALEEWIKDKRPDWRMSFEVGMGSFIKTTGAHDERMKNAAFSSYNSKRADFLLIDRVGNPMLAVEYHGTGHGLSADAPDRMRVKRLALDRAGIPLVEIPAKTARHEILRMVEETLACPSSPMPPVISSRA